MDANLRHPHVCKSVASNCLSGLLDLGHWQTHADDDDDDDDMRIIRGVYACKARLVDTQVTAATGHAVNW